MGLIQATSWTGNANNSGHIAISATGAGNCIILGVTSDGSTVTAITDSAGSTWPAASVSITQSGYLVAQYCLPNIPAGITWVQVAFNAANGSGVDVAEYSNIVTSSPADRTKTLANGFDVKTWTSGQTALNTSQADELLTGVCGDLYTSGTAWTATSPWTERIDNGHHCFLEDRIVSAIGKYSADGTITGSGVLVLATLVTWKIAGGGGGPTVDMWHPEINIPIKTRNEVIDY